MSNKNIHFIDLPASKKRLQRRHLKGAIFKYLGLVSIILSITFLSVLLISIAMKGYNAILQTKIHLPITLSKVIISKKNAPAKIIKSSLKELFPNSNYRDIRILSNLVSLEARDSLAKYIKEHPHKIGKKIKIWLPASDDLDQYMKYKNSSNIDPKSESFIINMKERNLLKTKISFSFFVNTDSREPEIAGIAGSIIGSFFTVIICMAVAFPLSVMAAVYLEEFAPKNTLTDIIEVNINNLAAVPSIVFGLLGLAIFISLFGLPRSSSLVGGLTLSLMILPTMIITTRQAIRTIPPSIKSAALALGSSPIQVIFYYTLPLAMPGIMTGTILSISRIIGETAPLIMIGMVAFIADIPRNIFDPATVMPVQIYLWSDSPEQAFVEKTSAAIIILLFALMLINSAAFWVRKKYEIRW